EDHLAVQGPAVTLDMGIAFVLFVLALHLVFRHAHLLHELPALDHEVGQGNGHKEEQDPKHDLEDHATGDPCRVYHGETRGVENLGQASVQHAVGHVKNEGDLQDVFNELDEGLCLEHVFEALDGVQFLSRG